LGARRSPIRESGSRLRPRGVWRVRATATSGLTTQRSGAQISAHYPTAPRVHKAVRAGALFVNISTGRTVYKRAGPRNPLASVIWWPGTLNTPTRGGSLGAQGPGERIVDFPQRRLRDLHHQPRREWQETTHPQRHGRPRSCLLAQRREDRLCGSRRRDLHHQRPRGREVPSNQQRCVPLEALLGKSSVVALSPEVAAWARERANALAVSALLLARPSRRTSEQHR
jgi:hypothetical protein